MDTDTPFEYELVGGRQRIIKRPRLTRLLDDSKARILLMVAPAGYGKTTLMRQWLAEKERRSCWYTGGPASADVAALCVQLADAVQNVAPGAGQRLRERLSVTDSPESEVQVLAELLAEDLLDWPPDAWLAFDDYQFATERPAAETFVALLLQLAPIRLILTTRRRPAWATARRVLYGEIFELTQSELSMTDPEATAVIDSRNATSVGRILERARGWPAVIGLASLSKANHLPTRGLPPQLLDYFAQEMYQTLEPAVQQALLKLAITPSIDSEVCAQLLGSDSTSLAGEIVQTGFASWTGNRDLALHPLLKDFLQVKLRDGQAPFLETTIRDLALYYLRTSRWDDAFILAQETRDADSLHILLETALEALLAAGRVATLEKWVNYTRKRSINSSLLHLAQAHIDQRRGLFERAEALALNAAQDSTMNDGLRANAFVVAGQGSYFADRAREALTHLQHARQLSSSQDQIRDVIWIAACVALEVDIATAVNFFNEFRALNDHTAQHVLRVATADIVVSNHLGGLTKVVDPSYALLDYLENVSDPNVRTGFLNTLTGCLVHTGRYQQASKTAAMFINEARASKLAFALPHALLRRADAAFGLRNFREAHESLNRCRAAISASQNAHLELNLTIAQARLLLAQGAAAEALTCVRSQPLRAVAEPTGAELEAIQSLALACVNRHSEALKAADAADELTSSGEIRALTAWVRAILALRSGGSTTGSAVTDAVSLMVATGHVHCFVSAYRAHPPILLDAAQHMPEKELSSIITRADDRSLARKVGLSIHRIRRDESALLTTREREVYELLSQGRSNRQIAAALFISETTTKVHVRHIFEKLEVRSRTEAASRAREILKHGR